MQITTFRVKYAIAAYDFIFNYEIYQLSLKEIVGQREGRDYFTLLYSVVIISFLFRSKYLRMEEKSELSTAPN